MIQNDTQKAHIFFDLCMKTSKIGEIWVIFEKYGICTFAYWRRTARAGSIFGVRTTNALKNLELKFFSYIWILMVGSENFARGGVFHHM